MCKEEIIRFNNELARYQDRLPKEIISNWNSLFQTLINSEAIADHEAFKTLIRKSDGQWMSVSKNIIGFSVNEIFYPIPFIYESINHCIRHERRTCPEKYYVDWSFYELIEVVVVKVRKLPAPYQEETI